MSDYDFQNIQVAPEAPSIPHNREAEEAVVGSVLINPDVFHECRLEMPGGGEEFYIHRHRMIWDAMHALVTAGQPIDLLTVSSKLESAGVLAEIGGPAYLVAISNASPNSFNGAAYAKIVHGYYVRRQMISAANNVATLAYDNAKDLQTVAAEASRSVSNAVGLAQTSRVISMSESVREFDATVERNAQNEALPGIPTPLVDLNAKLGGGLQNGNLYMVAALPGWGKTSLLMQIAEHAAHYTVGQRVEERHVAIFSLEMSHLQLTTRLASQMIGLDYQTVLSGRIPENKQEAYYEAIGDLSNLKITIDDTPGVSGDYIMSRCEMLRAAGQLDLVCVDYLGLMRSGLKQKKYEEIDINAQMLKEVARTFDVPVVTAHQMNREMLRRGEGSKPQQSDLREGGEAHVDVLAFIWHHEDESTHEFSDSSLIVAKHRNGPVGEVPVVFLRDKTEFASAVRVATPKIY